jgi:hypothetical protein
MQFQLFIFNRCRTRGRRLWWLKCRSLHIQITFHSVASALNRGSGAAAVAAVAAVCVQFGDARVG